MSTGEIISDIVTLISIGVTIYFGVGRNKARNEVKKLKRFLDYKKLEEFSNVYRETLNDYCRKITRPKWKETIQGKDMVGDMDSVLTEFNTHLPKMSSSSKQQLSQTIDEAIREFPKVRKGDEDYRDINLQHLKDIDRQLNEELENQRKEFTDLI